MLSEIRVVEAEREPSSECLIRFRDCDPYGHLHNTRYADYLLDAREEHLREHYGIDFAEYARVNGLGWVITSTKINFFAPARASEPVRILTRLVDFNENYIHVEARMYGCRKGDLKVLSWNSCCCVDVRTGGRRDHLPEFMQLCEAIVHPTPLPLTFEARLATVPRNLTTP